MSRNSQSKGRPRDVAATSDAGASASPSSAASKPQIQSPSVGPRQRWVVIGVCILLAAAVWFAFGRTLGFGFVDFDDHEYVIDNPQVNHGVTLKGIVWAFTHSYSNNWHPLTWISHMLDCQMYGLNAHGHHLTNMLLHAAAAILLFLVLRSMTGFLWRSALVAGLFAVHPLRVESVAWIAERKDVLSGVFFMLTVAAYVRYARRPSAYGGYFLVTLCLALGLMCKPSLVTLPFVLLLLDYWPLDRNVERGMRNAESRKSGTSPRMHWKALVREKLPWFGLSVAACAVTVFAQNDAMKAAADLPLPYRLGNALVAYVTYLVQMFYPANLVVVYVHPANQLRLGIAALSFLVLVAISVVVYNRRRERPWLLVGWLWYLGMLVPMIGIVQVGVQAHADRYTYLPQIGIYIMLTWLVAELSAGWSQRPVVLGGAAAVILGILAVVARVQTAYWSGGGALWAHALACNPNNYVAYNNLGHDYLFENNLDEAIPRFEKALEIYPDCISAHYELGNALLKKGRPAEAMEHFKRAIALKPDYAAPYNDLGIVLLQGGQVDDAMAAWAKAIEIKPNYAEAQNNLGMALSRMGRVEEAFAHCSRAVEIDPGYAEAHNGLGMVFVQRGKGDEAAAQYQLAIADKADYAEAHNNYGLLLGQVGRLDEAQAEYQKAIAIKPDYADAQGNLGLVLLQKGQLTEAKAHYEKALALNPNMATAQNNLGVILAQSGQMDEAIAHYKKAIEINPNYANAHVSLAVAQIQSGQLDQAVTHLKKAIELNPQSLMARNSLARLLATSPKASIRDGPEAIAQAEQADHLSGGNNPEILSTLAAAYAEVGRFTNAIATANQALSLATSQNNEAIAGRIRQELAQYQTGAPYREK